MNGANADVTGQTLHELARADAKHDFHGTSEQAKDLVGFFAGLLFGKTTETALNEDNAMNLVLNGRNFDEIGNNGTFVSSSGYNYNLRVMPNIRGIRNFGNELAKIIDGTEAAIIVDFAQHHFMEKMRDGEKSPFTVHYLYTQEVDNDPAGKPNVFNKALFGNEGDGLQVYSYLLNDSQETQYYTAYDPTNGDKANKFYSKYVLSINTNIDTLEHAKLFKPVSTLTFSHKEPGGKTYTKVVHDSGSENSISKIKGFICEIGDSGLRNFHTAVKYQQKRSGDWLQVLACNEVRGRRFRRVLPSPEPFTLDNNCPVFFVSHDRIAIAYALFMGVNAIYIKQNGSVLILKNMQDPAFTSGVPFEQRLFESMRTKYNADALGTLLTTATVYNRAIDYAAFDDEIADALRELQSITFNPENVGAFQTIINRELKNLFKTCVKKAFLMKTCKHVDEELEFVSRNRRVLQEPYNDSIDVKRLQTSIRALDIIQTKYGSIGSREDFATAILNWINKNAILLDVYRAANTFDLYSSNDQESMFGRVKTLAYGASADMVTKTVDNHLFLPYIAALEERGRICDILDRLMPKMQAYLATQAQRTVRTRRTNANSVDPFYYIIVHLISEATFILKPADEIADPIFTPEDVLVAAAYDNSNELASEAIPINATQIMGKASGTKRKETNIGMPDESVQPVDGPLPRNTYRSDQGPLIVQNITMLGGSDFVTKNATLQGSHKGVIHTVDNNSIVWPMIMQTMMREPELISSAGSSARSNAFYQRINEYFTQTGGGVSNKARDYLKYASKPVTNSPIGYHPYLPIYSMCASIYDALEARHNSYPFFEDIVRLVHVLSHLYKSIGNSMSTQKLDIIARGLYTILFSSHTGNVMYRFIPDMYGFDNKLYRTFSVVCDMFAYKFAGARLMTNEETKLHMAYVYNPVFQKYVAYVKLQDLLSLNVKTTSVVALKSYVKALMNNIVIGYKTVIIKKSLSQPKPLSKPVSQRKKKSKTSSKQKSKKSSKKISKKSSAKKSSRHINKTMKHSKNKISYL